MRTKLAKAKLIFTFFEYFFYNINYFSKFAQNKCSNQLIAPTGIEFYEFLSQWAREN